MSIGADAGFQSGPYGSPGRQPPPPVAGLPVASVTDLVYTHLRGQILRDLSPGTPLRLTELAAGLGVSTTPVRVAVERLRAEGLVVHRRGKGSRVAPLSLPDLLDIYAVRTGLESVAAQLGAPRLNDREIESMRQQLRRLQALQRAGRRDLETYLALEWEMHEVCYGSTGHPRLLQEIRSYRRQAERYFRLALAQGINTRHDLEQQAAFFRACAARDAAAAEQLARALLQWTVAQVAPLLEQSRPGGAPAASPKAALG